MVTLPARMSEVRCGHAIGFADGAAVGWVRSILECDGTLFGAAAADPAALRMEGRAPVYAVACPNGGRWVVRHYRRGGWMRFLDDRFVLLHSTARPYRELVASDSARARSIPTPAVVAGAVYGSGIHYRADLVTEYIPNSIDLAGLLFGGRVARHVRREALKGAGRLIGHLSAAGVVHADLNAKNVLVRPAALRELPYLLDLDRARVLDAGRSADPARMIERLRRSLRKFERSTGRGLDPEDWRSLDLGLESSASPAA